MGKDEDGTTSDPLMMQTLQLLQPVLQAVPGFSSATPTSPKFTYMQAVRAAEPARTFLADQLDLIRPTSDTFRDYFDWFFRDARTLIAVHDLPRAFLFCLDRPCLADDDRAKIVKHYGYFTKVLFKDPFYYKSLERRKIYEPTPLLVDNLLDFGAELDQRTIGFRDDLGSSASRLHVFRSLIYALNKYPEQATPQMLVKVIGMVYSAPLYTQVTDPADARYRWFYHRSHAMGHNFGLVRLMLYFGADTRDDKVKIAVSGHGKWSGVVQKFAEDVREVRYWRRWGDQKLFGGLPPEVLEIIMFQSWEHFCFI